MKADQSKRKRCAFPIRPGDYHSELGISLSSRQADSLIPGAIAVRRSACLLLLVIAGFFLMSGCAHTQKIRVTSDPPGARVLVETGRETPSSDSTMPTWAQRISLRAKLFDEPIAKTSDYTPSTITLKRKLKNVTLRLEREGYKTEEFHLERSLHPLFIPGGIVIPTVLGFWPLVATPDMPGSLVAANAVGWYSWYWLAGLLGGSAYRQHPGNLNITMEKAVQATTNQPLPKQ